ncbi:MAG: HAD hydrolase-like protein [Lachnospiraceae bacterium]|nr:HAD hydrolase-like protein [Lachnospiraceae bacterium]
MYKYVLFDLDGTLTDSGPGIMNAVRHVMEKMHLEDPGAQALRSFVGPPLKDSFERVFGLSGEQIPEAIRIYREYYREKGIFENEVYPGIPQLLSDLKEKGLFLGVASSKPETFVKRILEHFELDGYFSVVTGSIEEGGRETKDEVLAEALQRIRKTEGHQCRGSNTILVGDRWMDLASAKTQGIDGALVTFGYATEQELSEQEPAFFAEDAAQLYEGICKEPAYYRYGKRAAFQKTFEILAPLLFYWVIRLGVYNLFYALIVYLFAPTEPLLGRIEVYLNVVATVAAWPYLARCYRRDCAPDGSELQTERKIRRIRQDWPLILASSLALSLGLNIVLIFLGFANSSESYQRVADVQYSVSLPVGLVIYGILMPYTEEVLFRGVLQNRIMKYYPKVLGIFLSALLFGCYHGNPVQIIYAFFMGLSIALVYEVYQRLSAPVIMHCGANLLIYFLTKQVGFTAGLPALALGSGLVLVAAVTNLYFGRILKERIRQQRNRIHAA